MKVLNCYYSKGTMEDPNHSSKEINWDNIIFEGIDENYNQYETKIFGQKFNKLKLKREQVEQALGKNLLVDCQNKDCEFYYDSKGRLVQISIK